jgi:hypothetical protein
MTDRKPYALVKNVIDLDSNLFNDDVIVGMIKFVKNKGNHLFQGFMEDEDGHKRWMYTGDGGNWGAYKNQVHDIEKQVQDLVTRYSVESQRNYGLFSPSLIVSLAGCNEQRFHYDYDNSDTTDCQTLDSISEKVKKSFFLVVSICHGTKFEGCDGFKQRLPTIRLNRGDILIGRGDFYHAGASYDVDHIRIHFYIDFLNMVQTTKRLMKEKSRHMLGYRVSKSLTTTQSTEVIRESGVVYFDPDFDNDKLTNKERCKLSSSNVFHAQGGKIIKKARKIEKFLRFKRPKN